MANATDYDVELGRLIDGLSDREGEELPRGFEAIIALADEHGDRDVALEWRVRLIELASHCDDFPRELAAFDGLRRMRDADPEDAEVAGQVRWFYKWVMEKLPGHAEVSRERIGEMFDAMARDYEAADEGLGAVHMLRCKAAGRMGDLEEAARQYDLWQAAGDSDSDDCPACQTHNRVLHHLILGDVGAAMGAAEPILKDGQSCQDVPAETFSRLLVPAAMAGEVRLAEAMRRHVRRQVRRTPKMAGYQADHVLFLTLGGRPMEARRMLPAMLRTASASSDAMLRFEAFRAAWACLVRLAAAGVERVPMAEDLPVTEEGRTASVPAAIQWCATEASSAAETLDARNGNSRLVDRLRALHAAVTSAGAADGDDE